MRASSSLFSRSTIAIARDGLSELRQAQDAFLEAIGIEGGLPKSLTLELVDAADNQLPLLFSLWHTYL